MGLEQKEQWKEWCSEAHRPPNIPAAPNLVYADEALFA